MNTCINEEYIGKRRMQTHMVLLSFMFV